jgi:hypothetical protein
LAHLGTPDFRPARHQTPPSNNVGRFFAKSRCGTFVGRELTLQFFAYGSLTDTTSSANTNDGESPGHRCCGGWRGLLALAWRHQRFDIRCPSACESVVIGAVLFIGAANAILLFNDK